MNGTTFAPNAPILYSFVTKNINATYEIQGVTYGLAIYQGATLVSTVCDGLTIAYWQNATAYGTFGNGTHMTTDPLMPSKTIQIWNEFAAPSPAGTYTLHLTYEGHNAQKLPPTLYNVTSWTGVGSSISSAGYTFTVGQVTVNGGAKANASATISFYTSTTSGYSYCNLNLNVTILQGTTVLSQPYTNYQVANIAFGKTYTGLPFTVPMLSANTALTLEVTITAISNIQ